MGCDFYIITAIEGVEETMSSPPFLGTILDSILGTPPPISFVPLFMSFVFLRVERLASNFHTPRSRPRRSHTLLFFIRSEFSYAVPTAESFFYDCITRQQCGPQMFCVEHISWHRRLLVVLEPFRTIVLAP